MDYKLKNRDGVETTYAKDKIKIPAATGDSMMVFTQGQAQAEKTVEIAKNGAFSVEPDAGYAFVKRVSATVNVPTPEPVLQEKAVNITSNGQTSVSPDAGKDGLSKVDITVAVPGTDFSKVTANKDDVFETKWFYDKNGILQKGGIPGYVEVPANYSIGDKEMTLGFFSTEYGVNLFDDQNIPVPGWKLSDLDVIIPPALAITPGSTFALTANSIMSTALLADNTYPGWGVDFWPAWFLVQNESKSTPYWLYGGVSYVASSTTSPAQCKYVGNGKYQDADGGWHTVTCGWTALASSEQPYTITGDTVWTKPIIDGAESNNFLDLCSKIRTIIFEQFVDKVIPIGIKM